MLIEEIGELAIGIRLRRLYDLFADSVARIYKDHELDFEPKYFGLFYIISSFEQISVTDAAQELDLSHVGVINLARELERRGYVESVKSVSDNRKRMLRLSEKGVQVLPRFQRVWKNISQFNRQLFDTTPNNLLSAINEVEQLMKEKSYYQQYNEVFQTGPAKLVTITGYLPELAVYFKSLNIEWINTYFSVEEHDLAQLNDPETSVLQGGGAILFARHNDQVVGTCALIKTGDEEYELAKMAVSPDFQGLHIGDKLMQAALEKAKQMQAHRLWLGSSTKLLPALQLYKKYGFKDIPLGPSPYARADVRMELVIK